MRGLLLYNPLAGRKRDKRDKRESTIERIVAVLHDAGYELEIVTTSHPGSAGEQARAAIADGAEIVFACGGDGTVHDALQGVAGTAAVLAIIPMGSGNALCRELKIPLDPIVAAHSYIHARSIEVRVGKCITGNEARTFLVMAGAGPDGALMYHMLTVDRSRWGRWAYAMHALRLLVLRRFSSFTVHYQFGDGERKMTKAVSAIAMRVGSLGGIFPGIARHATLHSSTIQLVMVKPPALVGLPLWFVMSWFGLERWNPLLVCANVAAFRCDGDAAYVQVDGEWAGRLPMRVTMSDDTVRLLVPIA